MAPNSLYAYGAMQQAIAEAKTDADLVSNPRTCVDVRLGRFDVARL